MSRSDNVASGALMVIVGIWLVLQTIVGDLPRRLISWADSSGATAGSGGGGGGSGPFGLPIPSLPGIPFTPAPGPITGIPFSPVSLTTSYKAGSPTAQVGALQQGHN